MWNRFGAFCRTRLIVRSHLPMENVHSIEYHREHRSVFWVQVSHVATNRSHRIHSGSASERPTDSQYIFSIRPVTKQFEK